MSMTHERKTSIRSLARFRPSPSRRRSSSGRAARKGDDVHGRALDLSAGGEWKALRVLLAGMDASSAASNSPPASPDGTATATGETALHAACWNHPPLDIIQMLAAAFPHTVVQVDADGKTPLHVAAARGASPQVMTCLLKLDRGAASMRDNSGKTPIVLCCEKCCFDGTCDPGDYELNGTLVGGPLMEVVRALCEASPGAVNVSDDGDMTALEYAILVGATREVVKTLQKVSVKAWKAKVKMEMEVGAGGGGGGSAALQSSMPLGSDRSLLQDSKSSESPRERRRDSKARLSLERQRASFKDLLKLRPRPSMTAPRNKNGDERQSHGPSLRKTSMPRAA